MGKIRVKTFGDEELEQKEKEEAKRKKEAKLPKKGLVKRNPRRSLKAKKK